jgi:hypothetical protein
LEYGTRQVSCVHPRRVCSHLAPPRCQQLCTIACGIQITINRPERRNAFTPRTIHELSLCFTHARNDTSIGVVILRGAGDHAFCSGGDQAYRGAGGYIDSDGIPRLNVLDLQQQIRRLPKPVICAVAGYAVGGGHILHMICDLTVRSQYCILSFFIFLSFFLEESTIHQTRPHVPQNPANKQQSDSSVAFLNIVPLWAIICEGNTKDHSAISFPPNSGPSGSTFSKATIFQV